MRKYWIYLVILVQVMIVVSLARGMIDALTAKKRVLELAQQKENLLEEKRKLEQQKSEIESDYYLEKVARDQLHLVKPGEVVVLTPQLNNQQEEQETKEVAHQNNFWKWVEVFVNLD